MLKISSPWLFAIVIALLAAAARYGLIQPVELAHLCDAGSGPWWCAVRTWIIYSYAWYGLGYAAFGLSIASVLLRRAWISALTLAVSVSALILYCYEPGSFGLVVGTLTLVHVQSVRRTTPARQQHA